MTATNEHTDLMSDLAAVLNRYSAENASNTPDFILAEFVAGCLDAYAAAVKTRDSWYDTAKRQDVLAALGDPKPDQ